MSAVSLPVTRPTGRALLVGNPASRVRPRAILGQLGCGCDEADDAYTGFTELVKHPDAYQAVILSLTSFYKEELQLITTLKKRLPGLDIWLAQTEGRQTAMMEAIRLGADGLLSEEGLHRVGVAGAIEAAQLNGSSPAESLAAPTGLSRANSASTPTPWGHDSDDADAPIELELAPDEPILTAEELRALLAEHPSLPHNGQEP